VVSSIAGLYPVTNLPLESAHPVSDRRKESPRRWKRRWLM
jgi:hypothetical protein